VGDNLTAKQYLGQAYKIDKRIKITLAKAEKMRSALEYKSPSFNGTGGGNSDKSAQLADTIAKIDEYEKRADELVDLLIDRRLEIERAIEGIDNPVEREILERRYLLYQSWESHYDAVSCEYIKGIADSMGYSQRRVFQLHGEALKKINVPCKDCSKLQ
jgi:hypothetical protein